MPELVRLYIRNVIAGQENKNLQLGLGLAPPATQYDEDEIASQPSDEMKDELSLQGLVNDLEEMKREADRVLATPVHLPNDGDVAAGRGQSARRRDHV